MNSLNALGFLALGSVMNALPALTPSMVDSGQLAMASLSPGALWLHFMGVVVGAIGGGTLVREALSHRSAVRERAVRSAVPAGQRRVLPVPAQVRA